MTREEEFVMQKIIEHLRCALVLMQDLKLGESTASDEGAYKLNISKKVKDGPPN